MCKSTNQMTAKIDLASLISFVNGQITFYASNAAARHVQFNHCTVCQMFYVLYSPTVCRTSYYASLVNDNLCQTIIHHVWRWTTRYGHLDTQALVEATQQVSIRIKVLSRGHVVSNIFICLALSLVIKINRNVFRMTILHKAGQRNYFNF